MGHFSWGDSCVSSFNRERWRWGTMEGRHQPLCGWTTPPLAEHQARCVYRLCCPRGSRWGGPSGWKSASLRRGLRPLCRPHPLGYLLPGSPAGPQAPSLPWPRGTPRSCPGTHLRSLWAEVPSAAGRCLTTRAPRSQGSLQLRTARVRACWP